MRAIGYVAIALAILSGCTGPTLPVAGSKSDLMRMLVTPQQVRPSFNRRVVDERVVKPNCCARQKTLFVSDAFGGSSFTGAIYMFDYVTGEPLGQVAAPPEGFLEVQGGCSDNAGNVYFANTALSTIDEFNHSGTYVATLGDPGQFPVSCSFDKSTGDLAVANISSTSGGPGSLAVYSDGVQHVYYPPNMTAVFSVAYEGKTGTLWLTGDGSAGFLYDSFKNGTFKIVGIHGASVIFGGGLAWSGKTKFMNLGDQGTFASPTFYELDDSGNVRGEVVLTCTQQSDFCDVVQATIKGPGLVAPDAILLSANRFGYPAGGAPKLNYPAPYVQPIGSAVSSNKHGDGD
jgi:hypothetical protein